MKYIAISFFIFLTYSVVGQDPNLGFEDWVINNGIESPGTWDTNQEEDYIRILKSTDRVEGKYSMQLIPSSPTAWTKCVSQAQKTVYFFNELGDNMSVFFSVKTESLNEFNTTYLGVDLKFLSGNDYVYNHTWETTLEIENFTVIEVPIKASNVDGVEISIYGAASNGAADGCHNQSNCWIDGFSVGPTVSTAVETDIEYDQIDLAIGPNPSLGVLNLIGDINQFDSYELVDFLGRVVQRSSKLSDKIVIDFPGVYYLRMIKDRKIVKGFKVINIENK